MNFYKLNNNLKKLIFSLILLITLVVIGNHFLLANVIFEGDDYIHHAARTANYYLALKQGQFPVRWAPNLNYSYGYPVFNYTYHTPYFIGSLLHLLNFSIQQSVNISVLFSLILGVIGCYFFVRSNKVSNVWSILLSLVFIFNPYTLLSIYWRGAVGELYFYSLVPWLLFLINKLMLTKNDINLIKFYFVGISISTALIILSHLPSVIILAPVLLIFILTQFDKKVIENKLLLILTSGLIGLLLSSWYWIPACFEQWMITYQSGSSLDQYHSQFALMISIFDISKNFNSSDKFIDVIQIGAPSFLSIFVGLFFIKINKKNITWPIIFFISVFFLSSYSYFIWDNSLILKYVQYPWRFLWVITLSSILIFIEFLKSKTVPIITRNILAILVIVGTIFSANSYIAIKGTTSRTDFDWYQTFATGSSFDEHRPFLSKTPYNFPEELLYTDDGQQIHRLTELNPEILHFDGTTVEYLISTDKDIVVIFKRLFYPGWEAWLDGNKVNFTDNLPKYSGVLSLAVPAKESGQQSDIKIQFTGYTPLRKFSEAVSLISLLGLILFFIFYKSLLKNS
ncbi:MAG: hypothetical protein CO028_04105 [Candidatus Levybacteria bacterium CG_4_9_14_0_2_um_filter_35_21]|nr:MAG: hypothetical protein COW87_02695 [Candidatus Levybacteria bacterium CG22_combo_CG10-13_8_21_14_all_35_11]PJC54120.1 MAG: hypothetical protein CO028_04105 [Candidatus Levybacteria bacterium CG_4_9_14_0_2_um_filter_35_21]